MKTDRRMFLRQAAAAPLVFGLSDLFAQEEKAEPDWYRTALKRMKETGRHGIVLVAPVDHSWRRWGKAVMALIEGKNPAVVEILCEAVFICMTPELAERCVRKPGEKENRLLLDPEGKRIEADNESMEAFADPDKFAASFRPFLHGKNDERLQKQAEAIGKTLSDEVKEAFKKLDVDDLGERSNATELLVKKADALVPFLVHARLRAKSDERRGRLEVVINKYFESLDPEQSGPSLPYGTEIGYYSPGGCSDPEAPILCGMSSVPKQGRKLLQFLTK